MKVRQDFVTNSSSTSFIVSSRDAWSEENFLKAIGLEGKSPMEQIFRDLFDAVDRSKQDLEQLVQDEGVYDGVRSFLKGEKFGEDTICTVEKLLSEGRKVYYGKLDSDGYTAAEVYFCMESFVVCDDDIYFNGRMGGW